LKTRTLLRLFATALVPVSALANACGDDDNAVRTGVDGGGSDATTDANRDATTGDASDRADADADAPMPVFDSGGCSWTRRDGGAATFPGDGAVIEQPDSGLMPQDDAGPAEYSDAGYPSSYCLAACGGGQISSTQTDHCKPATNGDLWCLSCGFGRRPQGFADAEHVTDDLGATFAEIARLEAASVIAFRTLARELAFHRAPKRLVRAAERAARDEIRHARAMSALARRHGARVVADEIAAPSMRDLETIARENAVEGCVHETWGALLAHRQSTEAVDPVVRAVMKRVARDETRHAALGWQVAAWANARLDRSARDRVARARREASRRLVASGDGENRRLLERLDAELWSRAA
jgi:hypothetical protein